MSFKNIKDLIDRILVAFIRESTLNNFLSEDFANDFLHPVTETRFPYLYGN